MLVFVAVVVSFHWYFHLRYRHYPLVWDSSKQCLQDVLALNLGHKYSCLNRKLDCQQLIVRPRCSIRGLKPNPKYF